MTLPERVVAIAKLLWGQNVSLARGDDDARRTLTRRIAEQVCFELGPSWGTKSASESRPPSKDAIAYVDGDGRLWSWDSLNGSTREISSIRDMEDITGQTFLPVYPIDHLGTGSGVPTSGETPGRPPAIESAEAVLGQLAKLAEDLDEVKRQNRALGGNLAEGFSALKQQAERIYADLQKRIEAIPPVPAPPVYEGSFSLFGRTLTLTLKPCA